MISLRTICLGLALALLPAGCLPHSGTVPPPPERLRIEGSADPAGPIRLAWDGPDARWDLGPIDYRIRVVRHDDGSVAFESTTGATAVELRAGTLAAGVRYRVEVSSGNGSRSRARTIVFEPGPDLDRDGIDDRLEKRLAETFAPELHFNREVPGDRSLQNRTEIYFPSSIENFDAVLHSAWVRRTDPETGQTTKVPNPSGGRPTLFFRKEWERRSLGNLSGDDDRATRFGGGPDRWWPEEVEATDLMRMTTPDGRPIAALGADEVHIEGVPEYHPGDPPGTAATYTHVYLASSENRPDGSRRERYGLEYWQFYPQDIAGGLNFHRVGLFSLPTPFIGHRGDWEHTTYEVSREVDPAGNERSLALVRGIFSGHGRAIEVPAASLRLTEGTHPQVFVSFGKHAAYPAPGVWQDQAPLHDDVFRGGGVVVATWRAGLVDLGERGALRPGCAWAAFAGRWGSDDVPLGLGSSPNGPAQKGSWGRFDANLTHAAWVANSSVRLVP